MALTRPTHAAGSRVRLPPVWGLLSNVFVGLYTSHVYFCVVWLSNFDLSGGNHKVCVLMNIAQTSTIVVSFTCSLAPDVFGKAPCVRCNGHDVIGDRQTFVFSPVLARHPAFSVHCSAPPHDVLLRGARLALRCLSSWDLYTSPHGCALFRPSVDRSSVGQRPWGNEYVVTRVDGRRPECV